jgi:hypothetical protein
LGGPSDCSLLLQDRSIELCRLGCWLDAKFVSQGFSAKAILPERRCALTQAAVRAHCEAVGILAEGVSLQQSCGGIERLATVSCPFELEHQARQRLAALVRQAVALFDNPIIPESL